MKNAITELEKYRELIRNLNLDTSIKYAEPSYKVSLNTSSLENYYHNNTYQLEFRYPKTYKVCCGVSGPFTGEKVNLITIGRIPENVDLNGQGSGRPFDGLAFNVVKNISGNLAQYIKFEEETITSIIGVPLS